MSWNDCTESSLRKVILGGVLDLQDSNSFNLSFYSWKHKYSITELSFKVIFSK